MDHLGNEWHAARLGGGMVLNRLFARGETADAGCNSLAFWQSRSDQIRRHLRFFDKKDGSHQFLAMVRVNVFSPNAKMPPEPHEAYCYPRGDGRSEIFIKNFRASGKPQDAYKLEGAFSHEMGHSYHFWGRLFDHHESTVPHPSNSFAKFWERLVSVNGSLFSPNRPPWLRSDGRVENGIEQFANFFRFWCGTEATSGHSGTEPDLIIPGFFDPREKPQSHKMIMLAPGLMGYCYAFGMRPDTLKWVGGARDGCFEFTDDSGRSVRQLAENGWARFDGREWVAYRPQFTVPDKPW